MQLSINQKQFTESQFQCDCKIVSDLFLELNMCHTYLISMIISHYHGMPPLKWTLVS